MIENEISNDDVGTKKKNNNKKINKINWNDFKLKTGSWSIVTENG